MQIVWLMIFWAMQVGANLLFKYGTTAPGRYWFGFVIGNVLGASSIFVLMKLFSMMQVNVASALAGGGGFLALQVAFVLIFREHLSWMQYAGICAITLGMAMVNYGKLPA